MNLVCRVVCFSVLFLFLACLGRARAEPIAFDPGVQKLADQIGSEMSDQKRQRIAVIEFADLEGSVTVFGKFLSEELITRLFMSKKFQVVERSLLNKVIKEHNLSVSGFVDETTAREFGRILGVDALCSGTVVDMADTVKVNARLISTETGAIFAVAAVELFKDEGMRRIITRGYSSPKDSLGAKVEDLHRSPEGIQNSSYLDFSKWEILDGIWEIKKGAFYGSGGTLILREELRDYEIEVTVKHLYGPTWGGVGIGARMNLFLGGTKRYRNGTSDVQGYGFNFTFDRTYNLFNGIAGAWYPVYQDWKVWQSSPFLHGEENRIRMVVSGDKIIIHVNNRLLHEFSSPSHRSGSPIFWVQEPSQLISFSDIKISPR